MPPSAISKKPPTASWVLSTGSGAGAAGAGQGATAAMAPRLSMLRGMTAKVDSFYLCYIHIEPLLGQLLHQEQNEVGIIEALARGHPDQLDTGSSAQSLLQQVAALLLLEAIPSALVEVANVHTMLQPVTLDAYLKARVVAVQFHVSIRLWIA